LIEDRAQRLESYQDTAYAERFRSVLNRVANADPDPEAPDSLTSIVARSLFKLMAYKDEYEVARLYSSAEFKKDLEAQFEGDYELRFNLAPPVLNRQDADGKPRKREFGAWMLTAFGLLAKLRRLRGTPLDVFGYTAERRRERADIAEYEGLLEALLPRFSDANSTALRQLLALPLELRGYGHVKDRNRERLEGRKRELFAQLDPSTDVVQIVEAA
jgi:indolepyruvate ferredoxin oxidoreductase